MKSHRITVEPLGESFDCAEDQTLLDAALRAGIHLPHACGHGLCGTCKVQVMDGEVEHGGRIAFRTDGRLERDEGHCLACCAKPAGDVVIEADIDEEPDARRIPLQDFEAHGGRTRRPDDRPSRACAWRWRVYGLDFPGGTVRERHRSRRGGPSGVFRWAAPPVQPHLIELQVRRVPQGRAHRVHPRPTEGGRSTAAEWPARPLLRAQVRSEAAALHGGRVGPVQPALDDLRSAADRRGLAARSRWSTVLAGLTSSITTTNSWPGKALRELPLSAGTQRAQRGRRLARGKPGS